ncbi:MAG: hypothetical protein JNL80_12165 [Phycisphaerae bacterium]|jgi:hypothetical protein|nr:hypothetical protein [Phycisphaerae bacterium]
MNRRPRRRSMLLSPQVRAGAFVGCVAIVLWAKPMGLLLWARLRILANIPRTAIAEDEATLADRFEPEEWPTSQEPDVVVLPRSPSRNPFAVSTSSTSDTPRQSDRPHNPNLKRTFNPADGAGEGKSSGETTEENMSEDSDGATSSDVP